MLISRLVHNHNVNRPVTFPAVLTLMEPLSGLHGGLLWIRIRVVRNEPSILLGFTVSRYIKFPRDNDRFHFLIHHVRVIGGSPQIAWVHSNEHTFDCE